MLGAGDLPATLDVEVTGGQSPATIAANIQTWVDAITAGTGKAPMIYTALGFWNGSVDVHRLRQPPALGRQLGRDLPQPRRSAGATGSSGSTPTTATCTGISGTVDLDEYNGDLAALQKFAGGSPDWGAQYVASRGRWRRRP